MSPNEPEPILRPRRYLLCVCGKRGWSEKREGRGERKGVSFFRGDRRFFFFFFFSSSASPPPQRRQMNFCFSACLPLFPTPYPATEMVTAVGGLDDVDMLVSSFFLKRRRFLCPPFGRKNEKRESRTLPLRKNEKSESSRSMVFFATLFSSVSPLSLNFLRTAAAAKQRAWFFSFCTARSRAYLSRAARSRVGLQF